LKIKRRDEYPASRGFSHTLLSAFTESFASLVSRRVGLLKPQNAKIHAREKPLVAGKKMNRTN